MSVPAIKQRMDAKGKHDLPIRSRSEKQHFVHPKELFEAAQRFCEPVSAARKGLPARHMPH
jgi:hypothetical protein